MMKKLVHALFAAALTVGVPPACQARTAADVIEKDLQEITVSMSVSTLRITGANGETLHIYNVAGMKVMSIKVEGDDRRIDLSLPKGCYIVKVGTFVRKISIK